MEINFFPWENGEQPYFVNEEGFEWYIDKSMTSWCKEGDLPELKAVCFFVKKDSVTRVLIDKATNEVLHENTSMEGMAAKIDVLRALKQWG